MQYVKSQKLSFYLLHILKCIYIFKEDTRDIIFYIPNRYSTVRNKILKSYNQKPESKHILHLDVKTLYVFARSKFLPTSRYKWKDAKEFDVNKNTSNSSKGLVLEVDLEYPKALLELHNDCLLDPDKLEIEREMLSEYQLNIADLYNNLIGNVKKLLLIFF